MNTRLQVEHPVTECVFGLDLVALQIRVAEGERLAAEPPAPSGHAVEARLYAEDPARDWQPQTGVLHRLRVGPGLRVDAAYGDGDTVGPHYDPMLAKVIAHAPTRAEALRLLARGLERAHVHGPVTNRDLLVRVLRHPDFAAGRLSTAFLQRVPPAPADPQAVRLTVRLAALAAALADAARRRPLPAFGRGYPHLASLGGWRNVPSQPQCKSYRTEPDGAVHEVRYRLTRAGLAAEGHPDVGLVRAAPDSVVLEVAGVRRAFEVAAYGDRVHVDSPLGAVTLTVLPRFPAPQARTEPGSLLAPMPGTVVRLGSAKAGDRVEAGQPLLWLEAMKMEHRVAAPAAGVLAALHAEVGQQVEVGAVLAVVQEVVETVEVVEEEVSS
jgi:propionyl-CoA carboxylase alpha chain